MHVIKPCRALKNGTGSQPVARDVTNIVMEDEGEVHDVQVEGPTLGVSGMHGAIAPRA